MGAGAPAATAQARAGSRVLLLLSDPLNTSVLRSLVRGPLPVSDIFDRVGPISRTTRFTRLRDLEDLGVILREKRAGAPPVTLCMLSPTGRALLPVVSLFARWLSICPGGAAGPDEISGALPIRALSIAWDTTALRWLAERPRSLTGLDAESPAEVSYHDMRKARRALSEAGLIEPAPSTNRRQPYAPTAWARRAVCPLAAAIRWEQAFRVDQGAALVAVDAEALLLLCLPLIGPLAGGPSGVCSMEIEGLGGVSVTVLQGHLVSWSSGLVPHSSRVSGPSAAWLRALAGGGADDLSMQGGIRLTTGLTAALSEVLS